MFGSELHGIKLSYWVVVHESREAGQGLLFLDPTSHRLCHYVSEPQNKRMGQIVFAQQNSA